MALEVYLNDTIIFISDTHFKFNSNDRFEKVKRTLFLDFLKAHHGISRLYLVGDTFDFWFEYESAIPAYFFDVLCGLAELRKSGTEIMITGGNHDYWLGDFISEKLGLTILPDEVTHEIQGRKVTINHGDTLMPGDHGYKLLRKVIRSRPAIWLARLLHPAILFRFASWFSHTSKGFTSAGTRRNAAHLFSIAESTFFDRGNDTFVMGHVHLPGIRHYGDKTFAILGDWESHYSYLRLKEGKFSLDDLQSEGKRLIETL
jgi:UDP-2,3-diacylglucosamine hydrolase